MKVYATKSFTFDSAHYLANYDGACSHLHGHTYKLDVTVSGDIDNSQDQNSFATEYMVIDFKELKRIVKENVVDKYDHSLLNDYYTNPTAEFMVMSIYYTIKAVMPKDVTIECVKLWETPDSYAEFRGEK